MMAKTLMIKKGPRQVTQLDGEKLVVALKELRSQLTPMSASCGPDGLARRLALHDIERLLKTLGSK
jgi:hypothetical protein